MLKLISSNGVFPLTEYKDLVIESVLEYDDRTLSFSVPIDVMPGELMHENYIQTEQDEFVIKEINAEDGWVNVKARLNIDELEGTFFEKFYTSEQTIKQAMQLALAGTGWSVTTSLTRKRTLKITNSYVWDIIKQLISTYRVEIQIDSIHKNITFVEQRGDDRGVYFTSQLNLKSVSKKSDTNSFYTRIKPVGKDGLTIEKVNSGKAYIENHQYSNKVKTYYWKDERYTVAETLMEDAAAKLNDLSKPYSSYGCEIVDLAANSDEYSILEYKIGDVVWLLDEKSKIKEKQRIVKIVEYPDAPESNTCELANAVLTFDEYVQKYEDTSETVDNITTDNGTVDGDCIDKIDSSKVVNLDVVVTNEVTAQTMNITKQLNAVSAKVGDLETNKLSATDAKITYATIENLSTTNAKIDTLEVNALTANSAVIQSLQSGVANINTLMFGSATGGTIQTEFSNSVIANLGDAQIKSAMIKELAADKITGLDLNTTKLSVHSEDGKSIWKDNTIQISDTTRVRVQIGKDASGDYNIYIWDKNGKLMFDPLYGVQEDGIKKAIIRNDMISDTANISGKKIDIASLITTINEDGSSTLKASKIYVDADKQTLDISFKNMSTTVSKVTTTASSALTTAQGANSTASSALSAASAAAGTANTANSTANTAKTTAETANSTANKATSTASSALSTANTASANATSALNKVTTLTETVTTQGTKITTVQGQISSKVWQQDITTAVTSLEIGGRNLLTKTNQGKTYWSFNKQNGTVSIESYETIGVKINCTVASSGYAVIQYAFEQKQVNLLKPNTEYMLSFDLISSNTVAASVRICKSNAADMLANAVAFHVDAGTKWVHKSVKLTTNALTSDKSSQFIYINGFNKVGTVYLKNLKLEKGNKATDWTPAPEDTDSSILGLEATTKTLSTQYTSLNQTLTSLTATVNSNTTAISKKADGSIVTDLQANMTSLTADLSGFKTTVSSTYSTKTELNKASGIVKATYNAGSNTSAYCHLAEIKIKGTYANNPITICIHSRNNGESTVYIRFVNSGGTDPALHSIGKTGANSVYIGKTGTSTWQLYIGTSARDVIEVIDIYSTTHFAIIWKTAGVATCPSGTVAAFQMAAMGEVDYTSGGTSGSNKIPTSGSLYSTTTIANQTATKFQWIVKSGTSATDFTLTDRVASLLSAKFDIDALTTFKNSASNGTSTVINGGAIKANTITADKIKVDSLQAISAKIGGFTIDNNNIASGTWGTSGSVMMCTGTDGAKSIGGSSSISGWCFTAGNAFGVTKTGALYASNVKVSGDITATSGTIGKLVINGNYLQADSGTSGNVYRMYIQKPTSASTWCFSTQYGSTTKVGTFYARADGLVYCTSLTSNGAVSAGGNITTNGSITAAGKLTATGNLELRTSGNASNILLHDDYAKYCYIRYSGARLWFIPATDSGGFELANSASLDANTGTFYATAWGSNSSRRYKENITELTETVADRLLKIKTYHFDYKKDYGNKDMYGVIAEEVEQVHKNAVLYRNGEPDAVDYTRFIPLLIKKVQMQDKKLKYLENVVAHLIGIAMNPEQVEVEKVRK
ncbi:MAG: phage tail spike protein [Lachnospiraceae bacterium]|nr:MAG TPA: tail protein [Caudoviricetes sp.]